MARVDVVQRLLLGEALGLVGEAAGGARERHQVGGVALVEDREIPRQPRLGAETPEETVRGAVERAAVHGAALAPHELLRAREHLLRRAPREGEQEDPLGTDAALDQVGHAVDQRARLARPRAGDDEQGAVRMRRGRALRVVEVGGEVHAATRCDFAHAGGVGNRLTRHGLNISRRGRMRAPFRRPRWHRAADWSCDGYLMRFPG